MHDQSTQAPGAPAQSPTTGRAATIRAIVAAYTRPTGGIPMDGTAAPVAPAAPAPAPVDPAPAGGPPAPTPTPSSAPVPAPAPTPPAAPFTPPTPVTPEVPPAAGPPGAPVDPGTAPGERPLDQYPPEVRDYIASLRKEAADNRVKAKTAEDRAAEQMKQWLDGIAKTFGLIEDVPDAPPEQQIKQLGEQLTSAQGAHRDALVELAVFRGAAAHGADPQRLTDSRAFMRAVAGLDPTAADFDAQVAAAIGTAVAGQEYYRANPPTGQVPPVDTPPAPPAAPPVPSSGEFAGGTGGPNTDPQTVEDFRAALREAKRGLR